MAHSPHDSRTKLLDATIDVVRAKGYSAARVDDICAAAGVTKGSFFHHFSSKDEVAVAAAAQFGEHAHARFMAAPFNELDDPLDRLFGYLAFRKAWFSQPLQDFTCYFGTLVQETWATHPPLTAACERSFAQHAWWLSTIIAEAMRKYDVKPAAWTAHSLAMHIQAVLQGGFVLAKAEGSGTVAADSLDHLTRYVALLFGVDEARARKPAAKNVRRKPKARAA